MGWEKRRYNRVFVGMSVDMHQVDIDLNVLSPGVAIPAKVVDISATGMFILAKDCYRTGTRFRITLDISGASTQLFVIVRHIIPKEGEGGLRYGHGAQIIGATQEGVVTLVRFLEPALRAQHGSDPMRSSIFSLPPAA